MFKPFLESKISHSWVDPRKVKSDSDLLYEYKVAWAFANAASQILEQVDKLVEESEALTAKEKDETTNKYREAVS